jgi:DNA polymerase
LKGDRGLREAVRRRLDFERLFGLEEVYVGRKRAGKAGEAGASEASSTGPEARGRGDEGRAPKEDAAYRRRKAAVEAARKRTSDRAAVPAGSAKSEDEAAGSRDFVIEQLSSSSEELSLLSEAERSGIPDVAAAEGPAPERLRVLSEAAAACTRCRLAEGRKTVVFGEGSPEARLVFVGEAPGAEEDRTGRPFVGRAGKLLTKIIEAIGYRREDVYICNVIKCRPPGNRTPMPDEILACSPFLHEQLAVIRPKAVCALGGPASTTLLETKEGITRLRGRFFWYRDIPLMPTFHPAYLLRNPREKGRVWDDMKRLRDFLKTLG